jgi:NAD+ synthase
LNLSAAALEQNYSEVQNRITRFIKEYLKNSDAKGIVLGLSGGIDSAVTAALCSKAIGGQKVMALLMPEKETFKQKDIDDANTIVEKFQLKAKTCDITEPLESLYKKIPSFDPKNRLCKGNIKARTRMIFLYYYANQQNRIVCGTSDKSETMLGYFTKWGDAAADITPIGDLYKTQVRKLALYVGIPKEIAFKPSTPALWPEQLAEAELEIKYDQLDLILLGLERLMNPKEIAEQLEIEESIILKVRARWLLNEHKRRLPLTPKLGFRTIGNDFRLPRHIY